jgi:hypothetical protein
MDHLALRNPASPCLLPLRTAHHVKKCHGIETDHARQRRETAEKPQVSEDRHVTRRETLHLPSSV